MDSYTSLEQIKDEFQIIEDDPETIRTKLRIKQSSIHPDHSGGSFTSQDDEKLFHRISAAIEFIDNKERHSALVPVSAVTDLTKAVTELVKAQTSKTSIPDNILAEQVRDHIQSYRQRLTFPKIALSAITVALGAIWIFPNTVKGHPVLSRWFDPSSFFFSMLWLYLLLVTVTFWVMIWLKEERHRSFQESLKTETVQNRIFKQFLRELDKDNFSIEDLVEFLTYNYYRRYRNIFSMILGHHREINISMANTIADVIIKRALSRQAIKKESAGQISETYKIIEGHDIGKYASW